MPELPEVETIANGLQKTLAGKNIVGLDILYSGSFLGNINDVIGQNIVSIKRRAKVLIVGLSSGKFIMFHLKMTGQLIYIDKSLRIAGGHADHDWHATLPNSHTRLIFDIEGDGRLFFNDMRKFGWCKVVTKDEMDRYLSKYGPEPLPTVNLMALKTRATRMGGSAIKKFIMNQEVISGIGNIYADEILFASRIHPKSLVNTINDSDWQKIATNTAKILKLAVSKGGTTDSDYVNAYGEKGGMQDFLKVYHHNGEPCPSDCGGTIGKTIVGGRGTHFCPVCQKENKK